MYPKANDFPTVFKEIKQTDLKTSCWFRSSIHCMTKLGWKVQNALRLITSTATAPRELPPVISVKITREKHVSSLSEEADYHS